MVDPRPTVGASTELLYARLPELYRDADAAQADGPSNYPLLRYLSCLFDQLDTVSTLIDRLTYVPMDERQNGPWQRYGSGEFGDGTYGDQDTSDLVDPYTADAAWLPWLAQLVGVDVANLSVPDQRAAIAHPQDTWAHGTPRAIAARARAKLNGTGYVAIIPSHQGDPFTIALVTKESETEGATTWAELETIAPTWADLMALGDWSNLEAADVIREAQKERPAGFKLEHVYLSDL